MSEGGRPVIPPESSEVSDVFDKLGDDALLDLLSTEEDRVPRAAVDEILRRGPRLAPRLIALIDDEELWEMADTAPLHATYLVASMKPPGALDAVLRALDLAARHEEPALIEVADSLLASFGPAAVPALVAAFDAAASYPRIWIDDALAHIASAHPIARDAVQAHLRRTALEGREKEVCFCAAENFLALAKPEDRETLSILVDRKIIDPDAADDALSGRAESSLPPPVDWLAYYDPEAIARRQETYEEPEDDEDLDPDQILPPDPALDVLSRLDNSGVPPPPLLNPLPKVGRNEPCPCGSGRKFKKCCAG